MININDIPNNKDFPGIESTNMYNPTISSPYATFDISFYQTKESLMNPETYRSFLANAIKRFRQSRTYKNYKGFLIGLGLDRCQVHGNITNEMARIEMHHNMLNIMDISLIITEHILNTNGFISTFDLVMLLKKAHKEHKVQLVMLSLTPHQLYHNADGLFIHPDNCIGNWFGFLEEYKYGITTDIATKLYYFLSNAIQKGGMEDNGLLELRERILDWSQYNNQI